VTLLRARGAARRYGATVALEPTDLDVADGDRIALVGPNGAGKSTLLALLAGALAPTAGTIERVAGVRIGWTPQRPSHYARLTARENLELFARLEGVPRQETVALLERFDLPPDHSSGTLSVGNRQRLNLALSLLGEPDVLLLDEPTAALDPEHRARLWEAISDVRALVFVTQQQDEVDAHATRVVALDNGHVVS
jgi:ABC-type multidrug transport system ATPase subunit